MVLIYILLALLFIASVALILYSTLIRVLGIKLTGVILPINKKHLHNRLPVTNAKIQFLYNDTLLSAYSIEKFLKKDLEKKKNQEIELYFFSKLPQAVSVCRNNSIFLIGFICMIITSVISIILMNI